jgi:hypothetical protein
VELRPESGRGAEDHDDHKKPYGHVDRGVLGVARESRPHCGWICGWVGWGFFLPFHIREEGEAKGKLRAWSCREHALLRRGWRAVVALPHLIKLGLLPRARHISIDARHTDEVLRTTYDDDEARQGAIDNRRQLEHPGFFSFPFRGSSTDNYRALMSSRSFPFLLLSPPRWCECPTCLHPTHR